MSGPGASDQRVAVLVDCDNTKPEVLEYALRVVAQFGRVVVRRGYGNHSTLANKWQEALVRLAFTPCLQYQYASGKNTADIALALDAVEAMFDNRADAFCLVTSDSDFAYLCRKLRERGALVYIVGEPKSPAALRNASDQFFEYQPPERAQGPAASQRDGGGRSTGGRRSRQIPPALIEAVMLLAAESSDGQVGLGPLGQYLKRTDPAFSPKAYGYSGLQDMLQASGKLVTVKIGSGIWVSLKPEFRDHEPVGKEAAAVHEPTIRTTSARGSASGGASGSASGSGGTNSAPTLASAASAGGDKSPRSARGRRQRGADRKARPSVEAFVDDGIEMPGDDWLGQQGRSYPLVHDEPQAPLYSESESAASYEDSQGLPGVSLAALVQAHSEPLREPEPVSLFEQAQASADAGQAEAAQADAASPSAKARARPSRRGAGKRGAAPQDAAQHDVGQQDAAQAAPKAQPIVNAEPAPAVPEPDTKAATKPAAKAPNKATNKVVSKVTSKAKGTAQPTTRRRAPRSESAAPAAATPEPAATASEPVAPAEPRPKPRRRPAAKKPAKAST